MTRLPAAAALVIIDFQQAFDDPAWSPRNNRDAEANTARLPAAWRDTGRPVIPSVVDAPHRRRGMVRMVSAIPPYGGFAWVRTARRRARLGPGFRQPQQA